MAFISSAALFTLFLALGMLGTGTINTIATSFQDRQSAPAFGADPAKSFSHPFFQSACMFSGELLCLFVYVFISSGIIDFFRSKCSTAPAYAKQEDDANEEPKKENINPLLLAIPALCDLGGSTLLNVALLMTSASVYQMLRGTVVIFTGILSIIFLKNKLYLHHWLAFGLIVIGAFLVGLTSVLYESASSTAKNPVLGDILVVVAQVIAAVQFVVEEKLISKYNMHPLQCVGWEGFWGLWFTTVVLAIVFFIPGSDYGSFENAFAAFSQMSYNGPLTGAVIGSILSIAFFNFFGITITKRISSTHRSTIDACRTLFVWVVSMILGWEQFHWLEIVGFVVLVSGTFLYNDVIRIPVYHQRYLEAKERDRLNKQAEQYIEDKVQTSFVSAPVTYDAVPNKTTYANL